MAFSDLIIEHHNIFDENFCEKVIKKFDNDDRTYVGVTGGKGVEKETKVSTDLYISDLSDWKEIDNTFCEKLSPLFSEYIDIFKKVVGSYPNGTYFHDQGYQIQKTVPGGFYTWHHDAVSAKVAYDNSYDYFNNTNSRGYIARERIFTYIVYLNDRSNFPEDGRTQFFHNGEIINIIPEIGKVLLFPANVLYNHRGENLENGVKYLMTGWAGFFVNIIYCGYKGDNEISILKDYKNHLNCLEDEKDMKHSHSILSN